MTYLMNKIHINKRRNIDIYPIVIQNLRKYSKRIVRHTWDVIDSSDSVYLYVLESRCDDISFTNSNVKRLQ
jgi:hypothetical protein